MLLIGNPKGYQADKGPLGNYLFGVARNLTRRVVQRSRLDLPIEENGWIAGIQGSPAIWMFFPNSATLSNWSCCAKQFWRCRSNTAKRLRCVTLKK